MHPFPEQRHVWREFPKLVVGDSGLCQQVLHFPGDPVIQTVIPSDLKKELLDHSLAGHSDAVKTMT